ncbi:pyrroline-5-carboxylate reductase ProI [Calidifontibacillus oryziterrae]|uniref:pyrroline-5-carboxylate reductase ProI n=1 Tax=Calidifontibacillus oryziterrae TaxID=1191699 RepID=UPI0002F88F0A|nr:pyrroline-5-carboxylate reductase ProI [Calidifontibacillus oryziterrae]
MYKNLTFTFIGAGSMAEAMVSGMLNSTIFVAKQLIVTNRSNTAKLQFFKQEYGVNVTHDQAAALEKADVVILAMKPKDVTAALDGLKPFITENHLLVSVIAGVSTTSIEDLLGINIPIIRAMPNTSAAIGESATAISRGQYAIDLHQKIAETLFLTIGTVSLVDETDLHAVTGLSGSGPAYVYYLVEAMEKAALELGLNQKVSKELILQTIKGAAEMLKASPKHPSTLRKEVMSPGGTTEAGLKVLEEYQYQEAMINCIKRAAHRSHEMGAEIENMMIKLR